MTDEEKIAVLDDSVSGGGVVPSNGGQKAAGLSLDSVDPVNIHVRDLSINVKPPKWPLSLLGGTAGRSQVLEDISLDVPSGTMMAIIGSSGSGKTSLLNVMADRMSSGSLNQVGVVSFNGSDIHRIRHAYVLQQDVLQPRLTCRETLQYAAELRLPSTTTKQQRWDLVEEIILELGLKECADTIVGDTEHKGLSGGEKRRLSIGIQLLANPSVLFLDEPTTGLDATSAYLLVKTCHELAAKGRTLVMSIHQPRSDIFFLFDSVTILARGKNVYSGHVQQVIRYFENLGHQVPENSNPADVLIDLAAIDTRTDEQERITTERVERLQAQWAETQLLPAVEYNEKDRNKLPQMKAPISREIAVLTKRSMLLSVRDPMGLLGLFFECTIMGVITGLIFLQLDGSLAGIRSTQGLLYTCIASQGYLMLLYETYRLCGPDLRVFDREHNDGVVSVFGYLTSRRLAKCLTEDLFVPLIYSVIVYFMVGLRTDSARHFFIFFASTLLSHYLSVTYAMLAASISRDFTNAALVGNLGFTLQSMACGFFVNSKHMPVYVRWTKYIAYVYYALGTVLSNQFNGFFGDCPVGGRDDPACVQYTGEYVLTNMGFPVDWITEPLCINVAWAVGFYTGAAILLKYLRVSVSVSKAHKSEKEQVEDSITRVDTHKVRINIDIRDIKLQVHKKGIRGGKDIEILRGITANFVPGSINAILGPSGSGKSSLLNYIAGRLNSSLIQKYTSSGEIIFNGSIPSQAVIQSLCSYVTQDDEGLLASLTVRETLYYAAYLRLPPHMTKSQKRARADEIIKKMGLKDCADTLIGDEFVKGISGGEKRRVTICVQLLSDPKILLLDEPTSGLDAFTAASILQVLRALAEEGRTVICTIHQPRSDLFVQFGNTLLLARGGRVAYNGKCDEMLEYFASLGHPSPPLTNPADHVLDLVSINLQSTEKEEASRAKVQRLLDNWQLKQKDMESQMQVPDEVTTLPAEFQSYARKPATLGMAFSTLLSRAVVNFSRSPHMIVARIMQVVGIGIIFCLYFAPLKDNALFGVPNRLGLVQEITALYFVGMLNNMAIYPKERSVFYREYDDNIYGVVPFFLVYTTLELPFEIITCFLFSIFFVIIPNLQRSAQMFFACSYISLVIVNCGESIGIAFNTLFLHEGFAVNVISVVLSIGSLMAGILSLDMPGFLKGLNWLSPLKYSASVLVNMAFEGMTFTCEGEPTTNGTCQFSTGDEVLDSYNLRASVPKYLGALAVCMVVYRAIALAVLKINRLKLGVDWKR